MIIRYLPLILLAGIAAEIASIIWVGSALGVGPTLLLLLGAGFLGVSLIKSAGLSVAEALRSPVQSASPMRGVGERAFAQVFAGLLFLIPGFFSDLAGALLLLPPVRRWLRSKLRVETFSAPPANPRSYERVIEGEAIEITADIAPPTQERTDRHG